MKKIPLSKGLFALVDDADYNWLNQWKWHADKSKLDNTYYAKRYYYIPGGKGKIRKTISMHRLILGLIDPKVFGEHIDHNGLNCQRYNLRTATSSQNHMNVSSQKGSSSSYLGVHWDKEAKKWKAAIKVNRKLYNLGRYSNEKDAAIAYNIAALKYHKEFANLNKI